MATHTRTAAGGPYCHTGLNQRFNITSLQRCQIHVLAARDHDHPGPVMDLTPPQNLCCDPNILQPSVGARADEHLIQVDLFFFHLAHGFYIFRQMWHGYQRLHSGHVELNFLGVHRVRVRLVNGIQTDTPLHVLDRFLVRHHHSALCAGLNRHVSKGKPAVHGQLRNRLTIKLNRFIGSSVNTDFANQHQDQIFSAHIGGQFSLVGDLNGLWNPHPDVAKNHGVQHIGAAHASGKGTKRPISTYVGV